MANFMGRGNQYIQLCKVLYCKLPTMGKQLLLSHITSGFEPSTSVVGGKCVTIATVAPNKGQT